MAVLGFPDEPAPPNEERSYVASFAAKAAEWAGKAARGPADASSHSALESYSFARDAAVRARGLTVLVALEEDFERLYRRAKRDRWQNDTAIPASAFDPSDEPPAAWWKFWEKR